MPAVAVGMTLDVVVATVLAFAAALAFAEEACDCDEGGEDYYGDDHEPDNGLLVKDEAFGVRGLVLEQGAGSRWVVLVGCRGWCGFGGLLSGDERWTGSRFRVLERMEMLLEEGIGCGLGFDAAWHCENVRIQKGRLPKCTSLKKWKRRECTGIRVVKAGRIVCDAVTGRRGRCHSSWNKDTPKFEAGCETKGRR